jgi:hypothetical protein
MEDKVDISLPSLLVPDGLEDVMELLVERFEGAGEEVSSLMPRSDAGLVCRVAVAKSFAAPEQQVSVCQEELQHVEHLRK